MRIAALLFSAALAGCSSMSPAGRPPIDSALLPNAQSQCSPLEGIFSASGAPSRDGAPTRQDGQSGNTSTYAMLKGCHEPNSCHLPSYRGEGPTTFSVKSSPQFGFKAELFGSNRQSLGVIQLPNSRVSCTDEGLTVVLHHGMAQDGPGAWTIGHEKLTVVLARLPNGKLLAKRTQKRFDVFWFGLPLSSEEGLWFTFDPVEMK